MFRRNEWEEHMRACALSHAKLRDGEIQNLRKIIYKKVWTHTDPQYSASLSIGFGSLKDVCLHSNLTGSLFIDS